MYIYGEQKSNIGGKAQNRDSENFKKFNFKRRFVPLHFEKQICSDLNIQKRKKIDKKERKTVVFNNPST